MFNATIIGMGRAGQARLRTLQSHPLIHQVQTISVRHQEPKSILQNLQQRAEPQIPELFFICTDNATHYLYAKAALELGAHVVVEFPLCNCVEQGLELFELAKTQRVQLFCEGISLLSPEHQWRKNHLHDEAHTHLWQTLEISFTGSLYRWIETEMHMGNFGQLAIGRLQSIINIFGNVNIASVHKTQNPQGYTMTIVMTLPKASQQSPNTQRIILTESRNFGAHRNTSWTLDGQPFPPAFKQQPSNLFQIDLENILASLQEDKPYYLSSTECLKNLQLAEDINSQANDPQNI